MRCIISYMGYVFLLIASFAGITKMAAMKGCGKVCPGAYNSVRINAFRSLLCAAVALAVFLASGARAEKEEWWLWLISGVSNAAMMFAWLLCSERIGLVFVESFCMLGSVAIPLFLAPVLYEGEAVNARQWAGAACLLAALALLFAKRKNAAAARGGETKEFSGNIPERAAAQTEKTSAERRKAAAITAAYIALLVLSNAGVSITQKLYPVRAGKEYAPFFNLMTFFVVCACFLAALLAGKAFAGKRLLPENAASGKKLAAFVSVAAVMIYVYSFFATLAAEALPSAVYYPLARGVSMLLTVLCDSIVFRQKITENVWAALAFIFAAIALTSL